MHRNDLHGVLASAVRALKPDAIRLGMRYTAVAHGNADAVTVGFANGAAATGVACNWRADGIHSRIRKCLFGVDAPQFTGCVAWRGLIAMDRLPGRLSCADHQLAQAAWPRVALSGAPRRTDGLHQLCRTRRLAGRSWTVAGTRDELADDFRDWQRGRSHLHRQHRHAVQMGAVRARADAAVVGQPRHICLATLAIRRYPFSARAL